MVVADGLDASDFPRVANFLEAQVKGKAGEGGTLGCTVAALTKAGERLAVRLVVSDTRCANSGIRLFTATLRHSSMSLKKRYAQLLAEKERLEWEVRSSASPRGDADDLYPDERLGERRRTGRLLVVDSFFSIKARTSPKAHACTHKQKRTAHTLPLAGPEPNPPSPVPHQPSQNTIS